MANCSFEINIPDPLEAHLELARKAIRDAKGTFEGDTAAGRFNINVGIGDITGHYTMRDHTIHVEITKKPLLVSCKLIESRLKGYLE